MRGLLDKFSTMLDAWLDQLFRMLPLEVDPLVLLLACMPLGIAVSALLIECYSDSHLGDGCSLWLEPH